MSHAICPRKFQMCSDKVKIQLFKAYCTPLYTAALWAKSKKASLQRLQVAYNDCFRILLKKPRSCSASGLFCNAGVRTFRALLRNLMYKFICRLNMSQNYIVILLTNPRYSTIRYQSPMWRYWYECLLWKCVKMCVYVLGGGSCCFLWSVCLFFM